MLKLHTATTATDVRLGPEPLGAAIPGETLTPADRNMLWVILLTAVATLLASRWLWRATYRGSAQTGEEGEGAPVRSVRASLLEKLGRSRGAWDRSVTRFRALHWTCLIGVIVLPTCLASLGAYIPQVGKDIMAVIVAIFGSVQAIVKPAEKFLRDIEFRDEADYLMRQVEVTADPTQLAKIAQHFEHVERRFHQGQHPWPVSKAEGQGAWNESAAADATSKQNKK